MPESDIINKISIELQKRNGRIWRTIPGKIWKGFLSHMSKVIHKGKQKQAATLIAPKAYTLFQIGEPDCHLYIQEIITPDMVGRKVLLFGKAEIKTQAYKKLTKEQIKNLLVIHRKGGIALVITEQKDGSFTTETIIEYLERVKK